MNVCEERFGDYLKRKGLKFTPERRIVLESICSLKGHFDIEELYDKIRKKYHYISKATIYRTLPHLIESRMIKEVLRCQNRPRYERDFGIPHHDHLICIKCGRVIEFKDDGIEKLQEKVCKKYGFEPVEHRLGIRGYCKSCLSKNKKT